MFGRSDETTRLIDAADRAVEDGAQMALLSGEAGIGKTTLATATLRQLEETGWSTHIGHCIEFASRSLPFGPIVAILRSVVLDDHEATEQIVGHRRDDLAGLIPDLEPSGKARPSLAGDVDRLFEAIAGCLRAAAERRPVALLIEDIHWADAETRDLTSSLVRNLGRARVLLLATERSGAVGRDHPLRTWIAEHRRLPNVHYVGLRGLGREGLAEQAHSLLEREPEAALVDELANRTRGNPYFAEELLVARLDGEAALPSSLVDFLTSRLRRLDPAERDVLRSLAIAGTASHEMLDAMLPERPLDELVRSLFDAELLALDGERYTFVHSLLREAVLADLLPFERADLHRRAAEAIAADPRRAASLGGLSNLALHWAGANDPNRSLATAVAAATRAAEVAAYQSAADMASQALSAWPDADRPAEVTGLRRDDLVLQAADWLARCYRGDEAVAIVDNALATWAADLPAGRRALLHAALAPIHWDLGNPSSAREVLAEAERLVPDEVSAEAAQVHHRISKQAVADGQIVPARASAEKVIELASVVGPQVVLVEAMTTKALALGVTGDLDAGLTLAREARELALAEGFVSQVANTFRTEMLVTDFQQGRTEACVQASRDGLAYAERHCGPRWQSNFRFDLCLSYVEAGRFVEAEPLFESLMTAELDALRRLTVLQSAGLYSLGTDDLELARAFLTDADEIATRYNSAQETGFQWRLLAELARREGDLGAAIELIEAALTFQLAQDNLTYTRESILEKIRICRACVTGRRASAEALLDEARQLVSDFDGSGPANTAYRDQMELELAAIDDTVDIDAGTATVRALEECGFLQEAAEARLLVLEARHRDPAVGRAELVDSIEELTHLASRHGMQWVLRRLRRFATQGSYLVADLRETRTSEAEPAPELPHFLTSREVEVLSLVAEGLTNKGIGERLFVSPRTVSTHISNVLAKLGVSNRGEAAAAYHRLGLAEVIDLRTADTATDRAG